jgi:hypothetical protein
MSTVGNCFHRDALDLLRDRCLNFIISSASWSIVSLRLSCELRLDLREAIEHHSCTIKTCIGFFGSYVTNEASLPYTAVLWNGFEDCAGDS